MLVTVNSYHPSLIFAGKADACPSEVPNGAPLLALPENIRLGWKWQTVTNTQAYYNAEFITYIRKKLLSRAQYYKTIYERNLRISVLS